VCVGLEITSLLDTLAAFHPYVGERVSYILSRPRGSKESVGPCRKVHRHSGENKKEESITSTSCTVDRLHYPLQGT